MVLLLGHLPLEITEEDIHQLVQKFARVTEVTFLENIEERGKHHTSDYECMVKLDISDPVVGSIIANKLNHLCWKNCSINAHMLVF